MRPLPSRADTQGAMVVLPAFRSPHGNRVLFRTGPFQVYHTCLLFFSGPANWTRSYPSTKAHKFSRLQSNKSTRQIQPSTQLLNSSEHPLNSKSPSLSSICLRWSI
jgi:hypothetical protein